MIKIIDIHRGEEPSPHAEQFMVKMRDGVRLATDVYLPRSPSKHAAVLVRTPYDKNSRYTGLKFHADYYTDRGYVYIVQDVRGKFNSEGSTIPYEFDLIDSFDTVEWIISQTWSNKVVGVTGDSYYGYTAWASVACGHPAIRAAIPKVTGVDMGAGHVASAWQQGVPNLFGLNDLIQIWTDNKGYLVELDYNGTSPLDLILAARKKLGRSVGVDRLIDSIQGGGTWYSPYAERHPYFTTNIPILHWVNWYDPGLAPAGMLDWRTFRGNPSTRHLHFLRANSADHSGFQLKDVLRGDDANPYLSEQALHAKLQVELYEEIEFFDEHLLGLPPSRPRARAKWHMGHDGWYETAEFPPNQIRTRSLFLDIDVESRHCLAGSRSQTNHDVKWVHDPENPVPSSASIEVIWYWLAEWPNEREFEKRKDVITFTSDTLSCPVKIAGQPVLKARLSTTAPNSHLFVKLQDIAPDGTTRQISRGQSIIHNHPGEMFVLPLNDIAYMFAAGHRIQLQIQSSDYPYYVVHPGNGQNPWLADEFDISEQTISVGGSFGAELILPIF